MATSLIRFHFCRNNNPKAPVLLVIPPKRLKPESAEQIAGELSDDFRVLVMGSPTPCPERVETFAEDLKTALISKGIKKVTLLGMGAGASVAQALGKESFVRRLMLIDATTRLEPSYLTRSIDAVERMLPLGLPLKKLSDDFDSRPYLHRIHCPCLVLNSPTATRYVKRQAKLIWKRLPNACYQALKASPITTLGVFSPELSEHLQVFLQVPAKRPQKNRVKVVS